MLSLGAVALFLDAIWSFRRGELRLVSVKRSFAATLLVGLSFVLIGWVALVLAVVCSLRLFESVGANGPRSDDPARVAVYNGLQLSVERFFRVSLPLSEAIASFFVLFTVLKLWFD